MPSTTLRPVSRLLALVLGTGLLAPLEAEEAPTPTPAARTRQVLDGLSAQPPAKGLRFEGLLINNGSDLGPVRLSLEPAPAGSGAAWLAVDELRVGPEQGGVHILQEARLGPRLEALEGSTRAVVPGEPTVVLAWKRDATGYAFTRREGEGEPSTFHVESPEARSATMAATVFFVLHAPARPAEYLWEGLVLEANVGQDPQQRARSTTLRVGPVEKVRVAGQERTLPVVRAERAGAPDEASVLVLDEERTTLLQLEQPARGLVMRAVSGSKQPFDFQAPPRTAQAAALVAARAFAVADLAALDAVMDWEGAQASLAKDPGLAGLTPEARRARVLEELGRSLSKNPPALIEGVLRGAESLLEVEALEGGRVRVTFPPIFRNMTLVVRQVGDVWKLAELPNAG